MKGFRFRILVVDDEPTVRITLTDHLISRGDIVTSASSGKEALNLLSDRLYDIVITDIRLPDMSGMELLNHLLADSPSTYVVLITAYGSIQNAVDAMKSGAYYYLTKPFDMEELEIVIERIKKEKILELKVSSLQRSLRRPLGAQAIIGKSPHIQKILDIVRTVADTDISVLITGESGTGKELIAKAIHTQSGRSKRPFVYVNCSAIPETLFEAELFGFERGAFTGASEKRIGRIESARGGTLFFDEIGDIPQVIQVKLLRFLQDKEFERLGSNAVQKASVRIVSATNRDINELIRQKALREDLYYRLKGIHIHVPPLRERKEDVPLLMAHFLSYFSRRYKKDIRGFSKEALTALQAYQYPGNIRELEHIVEQTVVLAKTEEIMLDDLPQEVYGSTLQTSLEPGRLPSLSEAMRRFEQEYIQNVIRLSGGKKKKAAELLGISRKALWEKIKRGVTEQ